MKTTLIIDDDVMTRLKAEAVRQGRTISELVEAAIRSFLEPKRREKKLKPLPSFDMGEPLVDISDREALYEILDRDE
jgi:hypothetical protein